MFARNGHDFLIFPYKCDTRTLGTLHCELPLFQWILTNQLTPTNTSTPDNAQLDITSTHLTLTTGLLRTQLPPLPLVPLGPSEARLSGLWVISARDCVRSVRIEGNTIEEMHSGDACSVRRVFLGGFSLSGTEMSIRYAVTMDATGNNLGALPEFTVTFEMQDANTARVITSDGTLYIARRGSAPPDGTAIVFVPKTPGESFSVLREKSAAYAGITRSAIVNSLNVAKRRESTLCGGYSSVVVDDTGAGQSSISALSTLSQPSSPVTLVDSSSCQPVTFSTSRTLSDGAIAGIAVGCVAAAVLLTLLLVVLMQRSRKARTEQLATDLRGKQMEQYK